MIDDTGESCTDDLSVEVIATSVRVKYEHYNYDNINYGNLYLVRE